MYLKTDSLIPSQRPAKHPFAGQNSQQIATQKEVPSFRVWSDKHFFSFGDMCVVYFYIVLLIINNMLKPY